MLAVLRSNPSDVSKPPLWNVENILLFIAGEWRGQLKKVCCGNNTQGSCENLDVYGDCGFIICELSQRSANLTAHLYILAVIISRPAKCNVRWHWSLV